MMETVCYIDCSIFLFMFTKMLAIQGHIGDLCTDDTTNILFNQHSNAPLMGQRKTLVRDAVMSLY